MESSGGGGRVTILSRFWWLYRGVTRVFRWGCNIHYLSSFWVGGVTRVFRPNDHESIKLLSGGEEE
jgi:hypothetical protein